MSLIDFNEIIVQYRANSLSERDKGDRFENLIQAYLLTDPKYASLFQNVWLWNQFPYKSQLGSQDTGIDIVALTYEGDYWAVQCKCYAETASMDKKSVDSFLATSSRTFLDQNNNTIPFSQRLWVSTTNNWGKNAEQAIHNQNPPVARINLSDLQNAPVKWSELQKGITGNLARTEKKTLRPHQIEALNNTNEYFQSNDRGKLIMACGTGKTFTSLRIAEDITNNSGIVLFLVPSIALLGQTLSEWSADSVKPIKPICICSDAGISKKKGQANDINVQSSIDLALPATTDETKICAQLQKHLASNESGMTVIFSTYQSIDSVSNAQKRYNLNNNTDLSFDLVICDEAHRTTGVSLTKEDESSFTKVHDNNIIQANKRIYMTATPRLYDEGSKNKASTDEAVLCSMDDESLYGEEIYRIGFGEAVENNLLTDYKVIVLTLSEDEVPKSLQDLIADEDNKINADDASKLIGCINALSKQVIHESESLKISDPEPMRRAVAFCQNIKVSQHITNTFDQGSGIYLDSLSEDRRAQMQSVRSKHIDGSMSAPERDRLMNWLRDTSIQSNESRILTNVRCLSEGIDVPSLDAVLFLSARNSQVDVVQSVGRVMRKAPNKKYGYIIIPVVIPSFAAAEDVLAKDKAYKVVWSVLNALRSHDDRFEATINKINLNKTKPDQVLVGKIADSDLDANKNQELANQLSFQFENYSSAIYAKMVQKVGDRTYWERWARSVGEIVLSLKSRITRLIQQSDEHQNEFKRFLDGLHKNINPSVNEESAIEMLAQHIITKPIFEALFENYSFVNNNAISKSMENMMRLIHAYQIDKEADELSKFYDSVKRRIAGIDNAEGKQKIINEIYDKFFKTAFPKMVEQLGIVYTPVEVVDFIIKSVDDILKLEFNSTLSSEGVHILDPFTGTGTFITRLIQSGLISKDDILRKYMHEIHANEIVLLAYYIAAVNIENAFHDILDNNTYNSFNGICLTDTFQLAESDNMFSDVFPANSERVQDQKKSNIRIIIGNPPYSVGQKSENDNAKNQSYKHLDSRVAQTYVKESNSKMNKSLYDSYIKAFRWASDRIGDNDGIVAFVTNGAWLEGNSQSGFRKSIEKEFSSIYVFNLRGNQRTSGEQSRKEGGKIFGSGSRTPISITLLIKNKSNVASKATIHYHDIGDYLSRDQKLEIIKDFDSITNLPTKTITPNEEGDWIDQRNPKFIEYHSICLDPKSFFDINSNGVVTNRDSWVINYDSKELANNISKLIHTYNKHLDKKSIEINIEEFIDNDPTKIKWTRSLKQNLKNNNRIDTNINPLYKVLYRPYCCQRFYFDNKLNECVYKFPKLFPSTSTQNKVIITTGKGASKPFSVLMSDKIVNLDTLEKSQCFPLYYYEEGTSSSDLFSQGSEAEKQTVRKDGISDFILNEAHTKYQNSEITKEDIFYYVYGILHSEDYRKEFEIDLKIMLARLPLVDTFNLFKQFSDAGRKLAELHINYESVPAFRDVNVTGEDSNDFIVEKIKFAKKNQKDKIIYNKHITISNIPDKAYQYQINGKSAIEWILDRYQVKIDKDSQIKNDPNDWANEVNNPRYILDLLLSIINVSVQTFNIVNALPKLKFN